MKKLLSTLVILGGLVFGLMAQNAATVVWNPSQTTNVTYTLHWGATSRNYTGSLSVGAANSATVNLPNGKWYFAVVATDAGLVDSDYSNEAWATLPLVKPGTPVIVRIKE